MKLRQFIFYLICICPLTSSSLLAQSGEKNVKTQYKITQNGDTLPVVILPYVIITADRTFKNKSDQKKWTRLKRDVSIVYPYAKTANLKFLEAKSKSSNTSKADAKKIYKNTEKEIISEFKKDITKLTLNQGRLLIKLIDRECGESSYEIIKECRGHFQAKFWSSVSGIFNIQLDQNYNPHTNTEDRLIEQIIEELEAGKY